jgi:hypothetical protein
VYDDVGTVIDWTNEVAACAEGVIHLPVH